MAILYFPYTISSQLWPLFSFSYFSCSVAISSSFFSSGLSSFFIPRMFLIWVFRFSQLFRPTVRSTIAVFSSKLTCTRPPSQLLLFVGTSDFPLWKAIFWYGLLRWWLLYSISFRFSIKNIVPESRIPATRHKTRKPEEITGAHSSFRKYPMGMVFWYI